MNQIKRLIVSSLIILAPTMPVVYASHEPLKPKVSKQQESKELPSTPLVSLPTPTQIPSISAQNVPKLTVTPKKVQTSTNVEQWRSEVSKYDWPIDTALAVINIESGGNANNLNDNPRTKDYSVGLFQINLYGVNARTRPPEEWLKIPENNISYAYKLWSGSHSFCGNWTNTMHKLGYCH